MADRHPVPLPLWPEDTVIIGAACREGMTPKSNEQQQGLRARIRRRERQAPLDLPYHPKKGEFGTTPGTKGWFGGIHGQHRESGRKSTWTSNRLVYLTVEAHQRNFMAATAQETICSLETLVCVDLKTGLNAVALSSGDHPLGKDHFSAPHSCRHHRRRKNQSRPWPQPGKQGNFYYVFDS